jgi:hypothetical protein
MKREGSQPVIPDEVAGFIQSGVSIAIAVRDGRMAPDGTRAWAVTVDPDRSHVVAFVLSKTAGPILRKLEAHPQVALGFDRPTDNRACQIKGTFVGSRRCRLSERDEVERQLGGFFEELGKLGIPQAAFAGWKLWPCVAVRIRVTDLFHQTPGPGAGERMS